MLKSEERPRPQSRGRSAFRGFTRRRFSMTRVDASFEIVGPANAPVVVVLGGISASRHVTSSSANPHPGWWEQFCGPGRAINTDRFRILSIDYRGEGSGGQSLTTYDQALAVVNALDLAGV